MDDFRPSTDFVERTMENIRSYEREIIAQRERIDAFLLSKSGRFVLVAAGILLGIVNILRVVSIFVSPTVCF